MRYALRHWDGLTLYLDDGRIEMDTNAVERTMRPIKLNAKNSLFAGCDEGAESWAVLASLIETCKLNSSAPSTGSPTSSRSSLMAGLRRDWTNCFHWLDLHNADAHDPRLAA
ncbi:IS66 family transposase [Bradyrhizobium canariense]|uniref:IS66 family transposase n=1 Tax=Bradyrhizobium canariense TaxID=255045 RepID=UPI0024BF3834|nr:transposase [Bradyrhizobium canariense]